MGFVAAFDKEIFYNPVTRYAVLQMKTADIMVPQEARSPYKYKDHLLRFTAVGCDLPRNDAVKMELTGTWANGRHGLQFEVEQWKEILPSTVPGIRAYLASGVLKGIGAKTADAIVERFGEHSLEVLEREPERLLEIRGITEERLEEIKTGYIESRIMRELLLLLAPLKVTPNTAMKVLDHFGMKGVELLRESLFRLCEVPGFGFRRVDEIVRNSGGDLHDPMRVQGALFYTIEEARGKNGHLYVETEGLLRSAFKLLNENMAEPLTRDEVERQLEAMINLNVVVSSGGKIYLPQVYKQECETALKAAQKALETTEPVNLTPVMEQVKGRLGITLSQRQAEAVEMAFRHNLSIITGGPRWARHTGYCSRIAGLRWRRPRARPAAGWRRLRAWKTPRPCTACSCSAATTAARKRSVSWRPGC